LLERFYEEPMRVVNEHIDAFGMRLECDDNVTRPRQIAGEMIIDATLLLHCLTDMCRSAVAAG
jgi:hypothetical protein